MHITLKHIRIVVATLNLLMLFSMMEIRQRYTRSMPEHPDTLAARVEPVNVNYGKRVYVTTGEKSRFLWINGLFIVSICSFFAILYAESRRERLQD